MCALIFQNYLNFSAQSTVEYFPSFAANWNAEDLDSDTVFAGGLQIEIIIIAV